MYSFLFNYNKLHKITCYTQQSHYFSLLCGFMEFSRVDEWKSDIHIILNLHTEQSSGFEDVHYTQVRVNWQYQQRRLSKGRKGPKFLRNYRNIQEMKKANTCPYSMLTKRNDKVWTYMVSGILQKLSTYFVTKGFLDWGWKYHLVLRSQEKILEVQMKPCMIWI